MLEHSITEQILLRAEELETILKSRFEAEGSGLGEYTHSVENKLGRKLKGKLLYISRIRNEAVHKISSFQLEDPESFFRECDEAKAELDRIMPPQGSYSIQDSIPKPDSLPSNNQVLHQGSLTQKSEPNRLPLKPQVASDSISTKSRTRKKAVSRLLYVGGIMALGVQFFLANHWQFLWFKSYEHAFAIALFIFACGVARTAQIWQNNWVALGTFITTIGSFAWKYKWTLPIIKTQGLPLFVIGLCVLSYGLAPQLLGGILLIPGILFLSIELWLMFTKGLVSVHYGNLLAGIVCVALSYLMFQRQKRLAKTGVFQAKK